MKRAVRHLGFGLLLSLGLAGSATAAIVVDGTLDASYGAPASIQAIGTDFGDNSDGTQGSANGSELDGGYAIVIKDNLHIFLSGAIQSNFNKIELFLDYKDGGQNKLRGDNPNVDFNGLNRLGDDGGGNGLTFDSGFEADYYLTCSTDGSLIHVNTAEILTGGGGSGDYRGNTTPASAGLLVGGNNPDGIRLTFDNSNTGGVGSGCAADAGAGGNTGIEILIPASALGGTVPDNVKVCAFVNGSSHDFLSNQVLGPLPDGTCNLGEPRNVDFNAHAGNQFFTSEALPGPNPMLLVLMALAMVGASFVVLRRRAIV